MRPAHPTERAVGIEHYVTDADGIDGRLKLEPEDFRVTEIERGGFEPADADPGDYPHLVIRATLTGWDTNDFARRLSDALGISRERVDWAGTKDKHAVTTQLFSLYDVDADDIEGLSNIARADLEVVGRLGRSLQFGDLAGNRFEVIVRDPAGADVSTLVEAITTELREFGDGHAAVPNWFGQQRFGSRRPVTHEVGLAIARGDWEGAVLAYVGNPFGSEPEDTREAREYVEDTRDWAGALDRFPHRLGFERGILHHLAEHVGDGEPGPDEYRGALETCPSNLQRLFVNAAQSYLFNRIVSERLARGLPFDRPVAGDVVCFAARDAPADLPLPDADRTQRVTESRVETVARHCERGRAFVTAPLVGTETELADGEPGEIERTVLDDVGLEPADFDQPDEFHSTGTRRAILVRTDLTVAHAPLTFRFALPKGSYATVLLREYLKVDPLELG